MTTLRRFTVLFLTGLVTACAQMPARTPAAATMELTDLQHAWAAARVRRDVSFLEDLYAEDFRITAMNGSVIERDTDIQAFATGLLKPDSVTNEDIEVRTYGDTAVVTGIERVSGTYRDTYGSFALRFTNVFVRRSGRWKLVSSQSTQLRGP
jgi:ketosteroid isomerase-like protein